MTAVTKEDLFQTENRILKSIEEKFEEHEKREKLMFKKVDEHEDILRGKDRTSGMIKKINYLWVLSGAGAGGLGWSVWEFFAKAGIAQ